MNNKQNIVESIEIQKEISQILTLLNYSNSINVSISAGSGKTKMILELIGYIQVKNNSKILIISELKSIIDQFKVGLQKRKYNAVSNPNLIFGKNNIYLSTHLSLEKYLKLLVPEIIILYDYKRLSIDNYIYSIKSIIEDYQRINIKCKVIYFDQLFYNLNLKQNKTYVRTDISEAKLKEFELRISSFFN